ncbi:MAG: hypothetical protein HZY74_10730 [Brevundimonas sp.]|nr:MAG: hypothetical protein HZY74_10730 [Brevundimonas sp.]
MADEKDKDIIINTTPGVMGDGTEEQNLGQPGDPSSGSPRKRSKRPSAKGLTLTARLHLPFVRNGSA